jgi:PAS domain S-box-containing protein
MARAIERRRVEQSNRLSRLEQDIEARTRELARTKEDLRREIEERKQAADAFEVSEGKFRSLLSHMSSGFAYGQIILDGAGRPADFLFLEVNEQFEKSIGLSSRDVVGRRFTEAFPAAEEEKRKWIELYGRVALTGQSMRIEEYSVHLDRWFSISAYSAKWGFFAAVFEDVTRSRKNEERLRLLSAAIDRRDDSVSIADVGGVTGTSIPPSSA